MDEWLLDGWVDGWMDGWMRELMVDMWSLQFGRALKI